MPVTVSKMNRKKDRPPRQNVYDSFNPWRFIFTGWRRYMTFFIVSRARSRDVSLKPLRKMDPGRNIDFQTSVSRARSRTSPGDGGLSFTPVFPFLPGLSGLRLLRQGNGGHRSPAARVFRQPRVVEHVRGASFDADRAASAGVVVDDEDRIGDPDLRLHGVEIGVPHDLR